MDLKALVSKDKGGLVKGVQGIDPAAVKKVTALAGHIDVGSDLTGSLTLFCEDAKAAEEIKKVIDGIPALLSLMPPEMKEAVPKALIDNIKTTTSGNKVTVTQTVKTADIISFAKTMMGGGAIERPQRPIKDDFKKDGFPKDGKFPDGKGFPKDFEKDGPKDLFPKDIDRKDGFEKK
jgi:hypothetical protein